MTLLFGTPKSQSQQRCHPDRSAAQWRDLLCFSEKEKARWLAGPLLIGLQELDFGVFDDAFPYGLVLLFFAYGLGQCYRQDVFYAAGVVDAHVLDLIGG
jgi:hypothetical protein